MQLENKFYEMQLENKFYEMQLGNEYVAHGPEMHDLYAYACLSNQDLQLAYCCRVFTCDHALSA